MKWFKKLMGCTAIIVTLAACGTGNTTNTDQLVLNLVADAPSNTLHSVENAEAINSEIIKNFQEGLIARNLAHEFVPGMATDWEVSADETTYTFNLRDTNWSNGTPVTAHDFVFAFQLMGTLPGAAYADYLNTMVNGTAILAGTMAPDTLGVTALDDKTLEIQLVSPVSYFIEMLVTPTMAPINQAFYEEVGADNYGTSMETVLSNGPYVLTNYQSEEGYVLSKNADYWDAKNVQMETVNVRVVPRPETQSLLFDNGEIDRLYLNGAMGDKYEAENAKIDYQKEPRTQWMYLSGTTKVENKLLDNRNFRAAIAHAFDKTVITEQILKNGSVATDAIIPENFVYLDGKDYRETSGAYQDLSYSPEKAQEYFAKAKAELGDMDYTFSLNVLDEEGEKMVYEYVQAEVKKHLPEVTMELNVTPRQSYYSTLFEHATPAATAGWGADMNDPITFLGLFTTTNSINFAQHKNPEYDKLIATTATADMMKNPSKRWEAMFAAEEMVLEQYMYIPLYHKAQKVMFTEGTSGLLMDNESKNTTYKYVTKA